LQTRAADNSAPWHAYRQSAPVSLVKNIQERLLRRSLICICKLLYVLLAPPLLQFSQNHRYRQYITPRFRIQPHIAAQRRHPSAALAVIFRVVESSVEGSITRIAHREVLLLSCHTGRTPLLGLKCRFHCPSRNSTSSRYEAYFGHRFLAEITSPSFSLNKNMPETIYLSRIDGSPISRCPRQLSLIYHFDD
jgi:hypothetical protein